MPVCQSLQWMTSGFQAGFMAQSISRTALEKKAYGSLPGMYTDFESIQPSKYGPQTR